jgi:hypothetical protein
MSSERLGQNTTLRRKLLLKKRQKDAIAESKVITSIRSRVDAGVAQMDAGPMLKRGVRATHDFKRGDFVVEYAGELVSSKKEMDRRIRGEEYAMHTSYVFEFEHKNQTHW